MNTLLKVLGSIALGVICLWIGLAVLETGLEITGDLFYWLRRSLLPGLLWAFGLGLLFWGAWVVLFGPDNA
jgi:hypothetical protein